MTERRSYFPCFDGLRAIAAVLVLLTHVSFITSANHVVGGSYFARFDSGVSIFFVISGFLLYRPFVDAVLAGRDLPATVPFLARRALRIYPAYWLAAITIAVVFDVNAYDGWRDAISHLLLLHIYQLDTVISGPIAQAWSLGTEVAFYLALPLLALAAQAIARRTDRRIGPQAAFVVGLILAGYLFRALTEAHTGARAGMYGTWLPAYLDQFGFGMGLALIRAHRGRMAATGGLLDGPLLAPVSWALALLSISTAAFWANLPTDSLEYSTLQQMTREVLYGSFGLFLVLPAAFGNQDRGVIRGLLRSRVFAYVGLVSYGVYLWHEFFIDRYQRLTDTPVFGGRFAATVAFTFAGTLLAASLSYFLVERPILSLKDRWPFIPRGRPAALASDGPTR